MLLTNYPTFCQQRGRSACCFISVLVVYREARKRWGQVLKRSIVAFVDKRWGNLSTKAVVKATRRSGDDRFRWIEYSIIVSMGQP